MTIIAIIAAIVLWTICGLPTYMIIRAYSIKSRVWYDRKIKDYVKTRTLELAVQQAMFSAFFGPVGSIVAIVIMFLNRIDWDRQVKW